MRDWEMIYKDVPNKNMIVTKLLRDKLTKEQVEQIIDIEVILM